WVDEALELIRKAVALDPLSARTHRQAAMIALMCERFDEAAVSFQLALDLEPNAALNHAFLAITRLLQGRVEGALALAEAEATDVLLKPSLQGDPRWQPFLRRMGLA